MQRTHAAGESREPRERSTFSAIAPFAAAAALGTLALPAMLGPSAGRDLAAAQSPAALLWLGGAILVTAWLLTLAPSLSDVVLRHLATLPRARRSTERPGQDPRPGLVAALLVAVVEALLIEATVRTPVHQVLAGVGGAFDALVACASFALFLGLASRRYLAAVPGVETGPRAEPGALVPPTAGREDARFAAEAARRTRPAPPESAQATPSARSAAPVRPAQPPASTTRSPGGDALPSVAGAFGRRAAPRHPVPVSPTAGPASRRRDDPHPRSSGPTPPGVSPRSEPWTGSSDATRAASS